MFLRGKRISCDGNYEVSSLVRSLVRGHLLAATKKFVTFLEGIVFSEARERNAETKEDFHASHREIR